MSEQQPSPQLQQYPGYFPAKVSLWKRKWLQIVSASVCAFVVGVGAGGAGSAEADTKPTGPKDSSAAVKALAQLEQTETELDEAEEAQDELRSKVRDLQAKQRQVVKDVQAKARDAQHAAVRRAVAKAKSQQKRAVAAAVADAKAQVAVSQPAPKPARSGGGTDPRFSYCYEANDAGFGDYQQGVDPEYDWYRDNDGDGFVCER